MTDVLFGDELTEVAVAAAERSATRAGVTVREIVSPEEQRAVSQVLSTIWGRGDDNPVVPVELLRAMGKAGNYIGGAFDGDDCVGAAVAFHSAPRRGALHSHIAGVVPSLAGRSVGHAMKLHQRGWALSHGIDVIEWTFDPLVSRNAYFNIAKLAALPVDYLANFYGEIVDAINTGDATDRLLVRWKLRDDAVVAAAAGTSGADRVVPCGDVTVAVPPDIESLRTTDPERARYWRHDVRDRLTTLLDADARIVGFDREAGYILRYEGRDGR